MQNKKLSRREFMKLVGAGTCGAMIHNVWTPGFASLALAQSGGGGFSSNPILIILNLAGGASYNIAPIYHSAWLDRNPNVSYRPEDSLALSATQGLHPSLTYLKSLWDNGDLALINQLGFPDNIHSRSHDDAARMWMTAQQNPNGQSGIANRLSCQMGSSLLAAVSLSGDTDATIGSCNGARAFEGLSGLSGVNFKSLDENTYLEMKRKQISGLYGSTNSIAGDYVKSSFLNMDSTIDTIRGVANTQLPDVGFLPGNTGFESRCRDAAKIIAQSSTLGNHVIYLERGGFDTHSNEKPALASALTNVNNGLRYLIEVIKGLGRWEDCVFCMMSEFTRTLENASQGTDHAMSGPGFIFGGKVNGRIISPPPTNQEILTAQGFLRNNQVDTRNFISQIIKGMGYDDAPIVGSQNFDRTSLGLFSA